MEKGIMYWHSMSDGAILHIIGGFIQQSRLKQNKTQAQVAEAAGINRSTLVQVEKGEGGTLQTFIRVLRALEQLHLFQHFEARQQVSPLALAKIEQKKRQRARTKKNTEIKKPKSDW